MRTFLIAAFTASLLAGPAAGATRNFGIEGFTKVRIDGPYKVLLATGTAPFARAEGSSAALDRISIEVEGSTLAKADGSGPATIALTGGPACTVRMTGSATVSGCGSTQ